MGNINMAGITMSGSSSIIINGRQIEFRGGRIFLDGQEYGPLGGDGRAAPPPAPPQITLDKDGNIQGSVHGDLYVTADVPVTLVVRGDVDGSVQIKNGNIQVEGAIGGSASAGGNIAASAVGGSANAGQDITAHMIGGSARAGRDIKK